MSEKRSAYHVIIVVNDEEDEPKLKHHSCDSINEILDFVIDNKASKYELVYGIRHENVKSLIGESFNEDDILDKTKELDEVSEEEIDEEREDEK